MKKISIILLFLFSAASDLFSQSQATLRGVITDKSGETVIGANVTLYRKKVKKVSMSSDIDGHYSINTDGGIYDVEITYIGLKTLKVKNVTLEAGVLHGLNFILEEIPSNNMDFACPYEYKMPLIRQDDPTSGAIYTAEQISRSPK